MRSLLAALALCACSDRPLDFPDTVANTGVRDLATGVRDLATGVRDLTTPSRDLTKPPDLASSSSDFCAGTKLAGTCAQPFFAAVALCFSTLGTCVQQITPTGGSTFTEDTCWSTGQHRHVAADGSQASAQSTWTNATGTVCLTSDLIYLAGTFTANGVSLTYDEMTGALVCADGTTADIGAAGSDLCADVDDILLNVCSMGACS